MPQAEADPLQADPQDPLPESDFRYRRYFSYALTLLLLAVVSFNVDEVGRVALNGSETAILGLVAIVKLALYLIALIATYYMLAPSAEQMTKIIQTASALRAGVGFSSSAKVTNDRGTAQAESEASTAAPANWDSAITSRGVAASFRPSGTLASQRDIEPEDDAYPFPEALDRTSFQAEPADQQPTPEVPPTPTPAATPITTPLNDGTSPRTTDTAIIE